MDEAKKHPHFVFAAVKGDYGKAIIPLYQYAVIIDVPKQIRSQRIRNRSFQKFGNRMLSGGELYQQEEAFFQLAASQQEDEVESWVRTLPCPVIQVDGTKPVAENVKYIIKEISSNWKAG